MPKGIPVFLDVGLKRFDSVYPAAGSCDSAVEVTIAELEAASKASGWVDIGKAAYTYLDGAIPTPS